MGTNANTQRSLTEVDSDENEPSLKTVVIDKKNDIAIADDIAIAMYHYQLKSRSQENIGSPVEKVIKKLQALSLNRRQ